MTNLVWEVEKKRLKHHLHFIVPRQYFLPIILSKTIYSNVTQTENIEETHEGYHYFGSYEENAIEAFIWDELHQEINNQISKIETYQLVDEDTQLDKNLIKQK